MGTRGVLGFKCGGQYKLTYNHSDSYPSELGREVVDFARKVNSDGGLNKLKKQCMKLTVVDDQAKPSKAQRERYSKWRNAQVNVNRDTWYNLLRNVQGGPTLDAIYKGELKHMIDSGDFVKESRFCEYAYALNLDDNTIEFFEGFQKVPQKGNPFGTKCKADEFDAGKQWCPVKLVGKVPFGEIPSNWKAKFYPFEGGEDHQAEVAKTLCTHEPKMKFTIDKEGKTTEDIKELDLSDCGIEKIPESIKVFEHVKKLDLSANNIKKIENLNKMKELEVLDLSGNRVKTINGIGKSVRAISLASNDIENLKVTGARNVNLIDLRDNKIASLDWAAKLKPTKHNHYPSAILSGNPVRRDDCNAKNEMMESRGDSFRLVCDPVDPADLKYKLERWF